MNIDLSHWTNTANSAGLCNVTHGGTNNPNTYTVASGGTITKVK